MKSINYPTDFPDQGGPPKAFTFGKVQDISMYLYILSSQKQWTTVTALLYYTVASSNICYVSKVELFNLSTILDVFESRNHVMLFDRAR